MPPHVLKNQRLVYIGQMAYLRGMRRHTRLWYSLHIRSLSRSILDHFRLDCSVGHSAFTCIVTW